MYAQEPSLTEGKCLGSAVRQTRIWFPVLPVIGTVILDELLNFSEPQYYNMEWWFFLPGIPKVTQECLSPCHLQIPLVPSPKMHIALITLFPLPFLGSV